MTDTTMPQAGDTAPDFTMPYTGPARGGAAGEDGSVSLSDFNGQMVVLYFYPKDDTPGCTTQACSFRDNLPSFEKMNIPVIGVSKDSLTKHDKFIAKHDLNFMLASDEETDVCERYGTWVEKSMYGKKYMGIQRATFLIDGNGKIAHVWPKVKVPGHVEDVMDVISQQQSQAA